MVVFAKHDRRSARGAVVNQFPVGFREGGNVGTDKKQRTYATETAFGIEQRFDAAGKFRAKNQHFHVGQIKTVGDFFRGIAEVQRHSQTAGLQNSKINGSLEKKRKRDVV